MSQDKYFIYKYTFPNGKVYIGQTSTSSDRYGNPSRYKGSLVGNAFSKYDEYSKEILEYCTKEEVDERERYYIALFDSTNRTKGYNRESGGSLHKTASKDLKRKLSDAHTGLQVTKVMQCDLMGREIKVWPSIKAAATELGFKPNAISGALRKNGITHGFLWKRLGKYEPIATKEISQYDLKGNHIRDWPSTVEAEKALGISNIYLALNKRNKTVGRFQWKFKNDSRIIGKYRSARIYVGKKVYQYSLDGTFIREWNSYVEAANELGIPQQHIDRVLKGTRKMTAGFIFSYENKPEGIAPYDLTTKSFYKPVIQLTLDGEPIKEWKSIAEAEKSIGIKDVIGKCCKGKAKTAGGFKWKYKADAHED